MSNFDRAKLDRRINELERKMGEVHPPRKREDAATPPAVQVVALTVHSGTAGDETPTPCSWKYNFTDATGAAHTAVAPVTNRLPIALAAKRGIWDGVELSCIDEWPNGGPCP